MQDERLTVGECDELADAVREYAAFLPNGSKKENLLKLAECFGELANIKRILLRKVNFSKTW
jgi:NTP pyrophosphatase (non-canonical NTP hydrolase)